MMWAASIVLMPYALFRRKNYDLFVGFFLLFAMLSLDVMYLVSTEKLVPFGFVAEVLSR
jgi:hypothetical protein